MKFQRTTRNVYEIFVGRFTIRFMRKAWCYKTLWVPKFDRTGQWYGIWFLRYGLALRIKPKNWKPEVEVYFV